VNGQRREEIHRGLAVVIVLKDILTSAPFHSRGIKVRLEDGQVGRVQGLAGQSGNREQ
jgi:uncharacterized repeat protein (TIGR03833 family)